MALNGLFCADVPLRYSLTHTPGLPSLRAWTTSVAYIG